MDYGAAAPRFSYLRRLHRVATKHRPETIPNLLSLEHRPEASEIYLAAFVTADVGKDLAPIYTSTDFDLKTVTARSRIPQFEAARNPRSADTGLV